MLLLPLRIIVFLERGLDAQIHKAAGDELREFCRNVSIEQRKLNLPPCPVTTNVVSEPYNLENKFKHIIHVLAQIVAGQIRMNLGEIYFHKHITICLTHYEMKDVSVIMAPPLSMGVSHTLTEKVLD